MIKTNFRNAGDYKNVIEWNMIKGFAAILDYPDLNKASPRRTENLKTSFFFVLIPHSFIITSRIFSNSTKLNRMNKFVVIFLCFAFYSIA